VIVDQARGYLRRQEHFSKKPQGQRKKTGRNLHPETQFSLLAAGRKMAVFT